MYVRGTGEWRDGRTCCTAPCVAVCHGRAISEGASALSMCMCRVHSGICALRKERSPVGPARPVVALVPIVVPCRRGLCVVCVRVCGAPVIRNQPWPLALKLYIALELRGGGATVALKALKARPSLGPVDLLNRRDAFTPRA